MRTNLHIKYKILFFFTKREKMSHSFEISCQYLFSEYIICIDCKIWKFNKRFIISFGVLQVLSLVFEIFIQIIFLWMAAIYCIYKKKYVTHILSCHINRHYMSLLESSLPSYTGMKIINFCVLCFRHRHFR